jgi:hypothetical protein
MAGHAWLQAAGWVGRVVTIGPGAEEDEVYWETGMRALVLAIEQDCEEVWIIELDFRPFMDTNRPLMAHNFYDDHGVPRLTAEESKHWSDIDTWYMPPPGKDWGTRLVGGPVWKTHHPAFQKGKRGRHKLSVFACEEAALAWKGCDAAALAEVRAQADAAGFFGGVPQAIAA